MSRLFVIEDGWHSETQPGEYDTFDAAVAGLERRAALPWHQEPNLAPCEEWQTCGRGYLIVEYDASTRPWREARRTPCLTVTASGTEWILEARPDGGHALEP